MKATHHIVAKVHLSDTNESEFKKLLNPTPVYKKNEALYKTSGELQGFYIGLDTYGDDIYEIMDGLDKQRLILEKIEEPKQTPSTTQQINIEIITDLSNEAYTLLTKISSHALDRTSKTYQKEHLAWLKKYEAFINSK